MLGHRGVVGNEAADAYVRETAKNITPDTASKKAIEHISLPFLKKRAAEKANRRLREHAPELNRGKRAFSLPHPSLRRKIGAALRNTPKAVASHFHQLASGHALTASFPRE